MNPRFIPLALDLLDLELESEWSEHPEIAAKLADARARQSEYASTLSRLESLPVNEVTRGFVQRFMAGEVSIQQLDAAIDEYLNSSK